MLFWFCFAVFSGHSVLAVGIPGKVKKERKPHCNFYKESVKVRKEDKPYVLKNRERDLEHRPYRISWDFKIMIRRGCSTVVNSEDHFR